MTDSALIKFEEMKPRDLFKADMVTQIIAQIEKKAREHEPDLTTAKGRKAIASNAQSVASSKTFLDKQGKLLVDPLKAQAKEIDAERKRIRDSLDALKQEVRQPLTDWEAAEKEKQERAAEKLAWLRGLPAFSVHEMDVPHIQGLLDDAQAAITDTDAFGDLADQAEAAKLVAIDALKIKLEERKKVDKDKAELEEFRRMKEEADERDRKELAKRKAEKEAEEAKARKDRAEKERIEREKKIAEEAAFAERKRIEQQMIAEAKEEEKRQANKKHREKIEKDIADAFAKHCQGIEDAAAVLIEGKIPHVTIQY